MRRVVLSRALALSAAVRSQSSLSKATEERYTQMMADPECALGQAEYRTLQEKLSKYAELQGQYAVKQSEMERTKRAANVCGLEMPDPKRR